MSSLPDPYAGLKVIGISLISSIAAEVIMWAWAYRHPSFRSLKDTLEKQTRKLDLLKAGNSATLKTKNKKVERLENQMKNTVLRELQTVKLKQAGVMLLFIMTSYQLITRLFTGHVVAKLPFEPHPWIQRLSQRGLTDALLTDCSVAFLYALCQMGIRPNIVKLLDVGPSRKMNAIQSPTLAAPAE